MQSVHITCLREGLGANRGAIQLILPVYQREHPQLIPYRNLEVQPNYLARNQTLLKTISHCYPRTQGELNSHHVADLIPTLDLISAKSFFSLGQTVLTLMLPDRPGALESCISIHMYKTTKLEQACRSWNSRMDLKFGLFRKNSKAKSRKYGSWGMA